MSIIKRLKNLWAVSVLEVTVDKDWITFKNPYYNGLKPGAVAYDETSDIQKVPTKKRKGEIIKPRVDPIDQFIQENG